MYKTLKQILRKLLPGKVLFRYEPLIRHAMYPFYAGNNFACNLCGKKLRRFINLPDGEKLCPNCGSISRNRRLWDLLHSEFLTDGISVLDFSPSRSLYRIMKKQPGIFYTSTDFAGEFLSDQHYDITNLKVDDGSYDLIICYHVLEHIENDAQAMKELYRVLGENGICLIQTPFKEGEIYENPVIKTEEERLQHFGQKDHVRVYSVRGLVTRLSDCGFTVQIRDYDKSENNVFGYKDKETVMICRK